MDEIKRYANSIKTIYTMLEARGYKIPEDKADCSLEGFIKNMGTK